MELKQAYSRLTVLETRIPLFEDQSARYILNVTATFQGT